MRQLIIDLLIARDRWHYAVEVESEARRVCKKKKKPTKGSIKAWFYWQKQESKRWTKVQKLVEKVCKKLAPGLYNVPRGLIMTVANGFCHFDKPKEIV